MKTLQLIIVLIWWPFQVQANQNTEEEGLLNRLAKIEASYRQMASSQELFGNQDFEYIYKNSPNFYAPGIALIEENKLDQRDQEIFIYAMQNLKINTYLNFLYSIYKIYSKNKMPKLLLYQAIFPSYDWNTELAENFKKPKVVSFLLKLKNDPSFVDKKDRIESILVGEANDDVRELRAGKQIK